MTRARARASAHTLFVRLESAAASASVGRIAFFLLLAFFWAACYSSSLLFFVVRVLKKFGIYNKNIVFAIYNI